MWPWRVFFNCSEMDENEVSSCKGSSLFSIHATSKSSTFFLSSTCLNLYFYCRKLWIKISVTLIKSAAECTWPAAPVGINKEIGNTKKVCNLFVCVRACARLCVRAWVSVCIVTSYQTPDGPQQMSQTLEFLITFKGDVWIEMIFFILKFTAEWFSTFSSQMEKR